MEVIQEVTADSKGAGGENYEYLGRWEEDDVM